MKCIKCSNELKCGDLFCSHCGTSVEKEEVIRKISLKCEQCNGMLTVESDTTVLECPYCGHKSLIIENDAVAIERIKTIAHKEIEMEKIRSNNRLHQIEYEKSEKQEANDQIEKFRKSVCAKFLVVAFGLSAVFMFLYFSSGYALAGVLSLVQAVCFISAWCMGMNIIKEKKQYIRVIVAAVGIILAVPTMNSCASVDMSKNIEDIKWDIIFMGDNIPEPVSKRIEIHNNEETYLYIDVYDISEAQYYEYIVSCKDLGYTIEKRESSSGYNAYSEDGYCLNLNYYKSEEEMSICLEAPTEVGELNWNGHKVSGLLPEPKSTTGIFTMENDENNTIIVSNTTKEEFLAYCISCQEKGFSVDSRSESELYEAYSSDGSKVRLSYNPGNREMTIVFDYPMLFEKITWPAVGIGTLAPVPSSLSANVSCNYDWTYSVYLEDVTKEDYESYVQECIDAGFSEDIRDYGNSFWADYVDDVDISINVVYKGYNIMYVDVSGSLDGEYSSYVRKGEVTLKTDEMKGEVFEELDEEIVSNSETVVDIEMPNDCDYYYSNEWTVESLTAHFHELGFTNIKSVACAPDDDKYDINIFQLTIETGWFNTEPWVAGDKFDSDAEIVIYYNEIPLLTVENCPDLLTVLSTQDMYYRTFAEKYDGRYVEFDAYVTTHTTYDGGTGHIINVTGGDYNGDNEIGYYDQEYYDGLIIRIGDRTLGNSINESVEAGDLVTVSGRIDLSWSEYYKTLYVETMYLRIR